MAQILMVLTSHNQIAETGKPTGFWLEELAAPYYAFLEAGQEVTLASVQGGLPPMDPESCQAPDLKPAGQRFLEDQQALWQLANTTSLADITAEDFDAVFYPGGHGPIWDLAENPHSVELIEKMYAAGKPVASICHGPVVLMHAKTRQGKPLVVNRKVTCFSNAEEIEVGMDVMLPYLLEDELKRLGADYMCGRKWTDFSVADGHLITGQNPASSVSTANKVLLLLN